MYTHIAKGYTVGQTLTRRLFRNLTGIPGLLFDVIAGCFWNEGFARYWQDCRIPYNDGETATFFRGLSGWIGEVVGYCLGGFVGALLGLVFFIPDFFISRLFSGYTALTTAVEEFSQMMGKHSRVNAFMPAENPQNYLAKSWNVSIGTFGLLFGGMLYGIAKAIEIFLPIGNISSRVLWRLGGFLGGVIGVLISLPIYPVKNTLNKLVHTYDGFRNKMRDFVAFIYVKTNQEPIRQNQDCPCTDTAMHSNEFRKKVGEMKQNTTAALLFGELKRNPPLNPAAEVKEIKDNDPLVCPITLARFIKPVVDHAGHTFEESAIKRWLHQGNKTCPVGTEPLMENDLVVNRVLVEVLKKR